jgi:hypothetical protein
MSHQNKITINTHYTRSINLERDASSVDVVNAYIPTSKALRTFARIADALHDGQAPRAWSWIGPYGSGKSAASVFLGQLLSNPKTEAAQAASRVLSKADGNIAKAYKKKLKNTDGHLQILLTGSPEPMGIRIIKSLATGAEKFWATRRGKSPALIEDLKALSKKEKINVSEVIESVKQLQQALAKTECGGIVLIIDELGKFLEYEARHYGANDIYLLQALAEHACAGHQVNLMIFVLLHQSFEQYAKGLGESLKNEWSKVQGRFEEVPFLESVEQVLRVVSAAFNHDFTKAEAIGVNKGIGKVVAILEKQEALPAAMAHSESIKLFSSCYPLHPISALLLPMLCQKIAQNERTLFSYLGSYEEFGMQDMLTKLDGVEDYIYPHHIYDYFITNQSSALGDYMTHRRWAEVVTAIERLGDGTEAEVNLLKTIGILNIIGSKGGFKPSKALLESCMVSKSSFTKASASLKEKSVINFRRYSGEYRVWQGSDFDLEEAFQTELNNLGDFSLVEELNNSKSMLPIVARRYTIENGALRYFIPSFIDAASYNKIEARTDSPRVLFYLASGQDDEKTFYKKVSNSFSDLDIVVLCLNGSQLREAVTETQALRRVGTNCQELSSDPIAKREHEDRLTAAEQAEDKLLDILIDTPESFQWYHHGENSVVKNKRQLQGVLSTILGKAYCKSPIIHNELINRDKPSAQAVSARNKLLYGMLHNSTEKDLGIEKFPAEKAIYRSVLLATGLHASFEIGGPKEFIAPSTDGRKDKANIRHIWQEIETFLDSTEHEAKSFVELNEKLMAAPFGVKAGLLPVFYIAAYLLHKHEVAIYENRRYKAVFTQEMLERFVKRPDEFTVQRFKIEGMRASIFEHYSQVIHKDSKQRTLLELAQPLASFMGGLPEYTQKTKRSLSTKAEAVRAAFNLAKSPERLLFEELPKALGFNKVEDSENTVNLEGFSAELTEVLRELRDSYVNLLTKQHSLLAQAFNIDPNLELPELRKIISGNCHGLDSYTVDTQGLRAFLMRILKSTGSDKDWLENVLMFLGHKPSAKWTDSDQDTAEYRLTDFSRRVIDLEKLRIHERDRSAKMEGDFDVYLLRSVKKGGDILDDVVAIDSKSAKRINTTSEAIKEALNGLQDKELMLAALAQTVNNFLIDYKKSTKAKSDEVKSKKSVRSKS